MTVHRYLAPPVNFLLSRRKKHHTRGAGGSKFANACKRKRGRNEGHNAGGGENTPTPIKDSNMNRSIVSLSAVILSLLLMTSTAYAEGGGASGLWMVCKEKKKFYSLVDHALHHRDAELKEQWMLAILTGECTGFQVWEKLIVTGKARYSGVDLAKVHREDETTEYWTFIQAVR